MISKKDLLILEILEKNTKTSTKEITEKTGIPQTTVHNRIKRMEKMGIIKGYKAILDKKKLGKAIGAYVLITVSYPQDTKKDFQSDIAKKIAEMPEVEELSIITGETDIILKLFVNDTDELNDFVTRKLRTIEGIDKTRTCVILKQLK